MVRRHDERFGSVRPEQSNAAARIAAHADVQITMGESLNRLEALMERHIKEGHNGRDLIRSKNCRCGLIVVGRQ